MPPGKADVDIWATTHINNVVTTLYARFCWHLCVYSNSRNDVPRVAQWYGTIAAHTRRHASVPVVFCVHVYSFAGLIRRMPPPTFRDTAVTYRHSGTSIFQLRAHWVRISWSTGSEKSSRWESNPRLPACKVSTLSTRPGSPPFLLASHEKAPYDVHTRKTQIRLHSCAN